MNNTTTRDTGAADKVKGHAKQLIGNVKEKLGGAIGDDRLEAEGRADRIEGTADRAKGEVKQKLDQAGEKLSETVAKAKAGVEVLTERAKDAVRGDRH